MRYDVLGQGARPMRGDEKERKNPRTKMTSDLSSAAAAVMPPALGKKRKNRRSADAAVMVKSDKVKESFDPYDPKVLAANGIEYPSNDGRMMLKYWAYRVQLEGNLSADKMIPPPVGVIRHPDLMEKCWGWWRLLPMYRCARRDLPLYKQYLCEYYIRNAPESVDGHTLTEARLVNRSAWTNENGRLIPLARLCVVMEDKFMAQCKRSALDLTDSEINLSNKIHLCARNIINGVCEYTGAYAAAAALVCIAKEAELLREWVIQGQYSSSDPDCILSNQIRDHAFCLILHKASGSIAATAGAAMVGAAREAKLLCDFLRQDLNLDIALSAEIREEAHAILLDLCNEAAAANGTNIAVADHAEDKPTRIKTVRNFNCTESDGNEDLKRMLGSEGCTYMENA